jgi:hypothetical protein
MKKIAFVAVLIAVIAGIVFGGIALASPAPKPPPTSGPVYMENLYGNATIQSESNKNLVEKFYPGIRHVSLTIHFTDLSINQRSVWLSASANGYYVFGQTWSLQTADTVNVQFDTDHWLLLASDFTSPTAPGGITVIYAATVTYYPGS